MNSNMHNKIAIVSGGAGGLGKETATQFALENAIVIILDSNIEGTEKTAKSINEKVGKEVCFAYEIDIRNENLVKQAISSIVSKFGTIDILVNCAGIARGNNQKAEDGSWLPMEEVSVEDFEKVISINLTGTFLLCKHVAKIMIKKGYGRIINTASISALVANRGLQGLGPYSASKGGVISLTKVLAVEWAQYGITVNSISPGYMKTEMGTRSQTMKGFKELQLSLIPQGRLGLPEEYAAAVLYLASEHAGHTTGMNLVMDGGYTAW